MPLLPPQSRTLLLSCWLVVVSNVAVWILLRMEAGPLWRPKCRRRCWGRMWLPWRVSWCR